MKIAFDIDGTLQGQFRTVNWVHNALRRYAEDGHDIIVWSGGGIDYAKRYVETHKLPARVIRKCTEDVDIAFDDAYDHIAGATITIQVPLAD